MSNILSYEFCELPLVIAPGIEAGLTNGLAEIKYDRSGNWEIDSISIEGHQALTLEQIQAGKKKWVYVAAPEPLASMIHDRLVEEREWYGRISDAVQEQLAADREDAYDMRRDMRRDDRMLGL